MVIAGSLQISLNAHSCNYLVDKDLSKRLNNGSKVNFVYSVVFSPPHRLFRRGGFACGAAADRAGAAIDAGRAEQAHAGGGEVVVRKRHQGT